jgi:phospholipase/carboxylesterase
MLEIVRRGVSLDRAEKVAIMLHGRGASAQSILELEKYLNLEGFALVAPQAKGNTWYPFSFMAPDASNEPALSNSIRHLEDLVSGLYSQGLESEQIYWIGFSQGACLSLEFAARHARTYGGVVAFTGGLVGEKLQPERYAGDFAGTPVFIGASFKDMHVPLERIEASTKLMESMGATVKTMIFQDTMHTIRQEELDWVNKNIL